MVENRKSHAEELTKIGVLDIADLDVNRSGHLSQRQKRMLYLNLAFWLIIASFDLIILAFFIYFQLIFQRNLTTAIIWSSLLIVAAYMCTKNAKPYWKDTQDDRPNTVSGKIYKHFTMRSGMAGGRSEIGYCNIRIGDQIFTISPAIYDHVIDEEHYRVYFVRNSRKLLNIEPL